MRRSQSGLKRFEYFGFIFIEVVEPQKPQLWSISQKFTLQYHNQFTKKPLTIRN